MKKVYAVNRVGTSESLDGEVRLSDLMAAPETRVIMMDTDLSADAEYTIRNELCYATPCFAILCYATLYYATLYYTIPILHLYLYLYI